MSGRSSSPLVDGVVGPDIDGDILSAGDDRSVRKGGRRIGLGYVRGSGSARGDRLERQRGLREHRDGGANPADMAVAMNHLASTGGGKIVVGR